MIKCSNPKLPSTSCEYLHTSWNSRHECESKKLHRHWWSCCLSLCSLGVASSLYFAPAGEIRPHYPRSERLPGAIGSRIRLRPEIVKFREACITVAGEWPNLDKNDYRAEKISLYVVCWSLFLLLFITSASIGLNHSRNHVQRNILSSVTKPNMDISNTSWMFHFTIPELIYSKSSQIQRVGQMETNDSREGS